MKLVKTLIPILAILFITGCSTMADSIAAKGTGPYRIYEQNKDEVWREAINAVNSTELDLVSENKQSGVILAQRSMSVFSYGENVAIFVEDYEDKQCRVEVVSKKAMSTNIFAPDWSESIFDYLDARLK